jgi:hypothetical protein
MGVDIAVDKDLGVHFERYVSGIRAAWGDGTSASLPGRVTELMQELLRESPEAEEWIHRLLEKQPPALALYRDPDHDFIQMGHYHPKGKPNVFSPHDHGPYWVVYGVYTGEVEIRTYKRVDDLSEAGKARLEVLDTHRLTPGVARAYQVGEIHSTHDYTAEQGVVLRFLSADLEKVTVRRYNTERGTVTGC